VLAGDPAIGRQPGHKHRIDRKRGRTIRSRRTGHGSGRPGHRQCALFRDGASLAPPAPAIGRAMTWQTQHPPADHPPVHSGGVGVLLVNLGTPDAPDAPSVKRYLAEFLSDRRVVEIPPLAWQPILRGVI